MTPGTGWPLALLGTHLGSLGVRSLWRKEMAQAGRGSEAQLGVRPREAFPAAKATSELQGSVGDGLAQQVGIHPHEPFLRPVSECLLCAGGRGQGCLRSV